MKSRRFVKQAEGDLKRGWNDLEMSQRLYEDSKT